MSFVDRDYLVLEFAKRWNYALPAYPPPEYDYGVVLAK